jgi:hypothetical protein
VFPRIFAFGAGAWRHGTPNCPSDAICFVVWAVSSRSPGETIAMMDEFRTQIENTALTHSYRR